MNFPNAVTHGFKNYFNFEGRASRSEFWWFFLGTIIIQVVVQYIDSQMGTTPKLAILTSVLIFIPLLAVTARRLHDTNRSGWLQLVGLIPVIGAILLIIWYASGSNPEENKYGPVPE